MDCGSGLEARQSGFVYDAQGVAAISRADRACNVEGVYRHGSRLTLTAGFAGISRATTAGTCANQAVSAS